MKKTFTPLALGLCLTGSLALAQTPASDRVVLSAGFISAQGDALDMTHKATGGYLFEVGYQFSPKDYGIDFLIYGGWKKLPADTATPQRPTHEMVGPHVGFDLVYRPWVSLPLTLSTGPSAHVWQVEAQGVPEGNMGDQGVKLGWRIGADYDLNAQWSVGLKYTLTEWRSTPDRGIPPTRPAFISLVGSYRF